MAEQNGAPHARILRELAKAERALSTAFDTAVNTDQPHEWWAPIAKASGEVNAAKQAIVTHTPRPATGAVRGEQ